jgi:hypothetical protein
MTPARDGIDRTTRRPAARWDPRAVGGAAAGGGTGVTAGAGAVPGGPSGTGDGGVTRCSLY